MNEDLLFPRLSPDQIACLRPLGLELCLNAGDTLFREGDPEEEFYVVVEGELRIVKQITGSEMTLRVHRAGEFTGALSMFGGGASIATGRAVTPCRLLRVDREGFARMFTVCPPIAAAVLMTMAERRPEAEAMIRQREKLAALGKLSAGLAHELNNPAAAARRAAGDLQETLQRLQALTLKLGELPLTTDTREWLTGFTQQVMARERASGSEDPLARSDREEALCGWLDGRHIPGGWELAPTLAEAGLDPAQLDALAGRVGEAALPDTLAWLTAAAAARDLARQVENSAARISELVTAIKSYSYMDQSPVQEVDVHEGLESTLTILGHNLKSIKIARVYDRSLPRLPAFGSELNQVWTNLIDNAADAMGGRGTLTLRTAREGKYALVEIGDDGPGIPAEVLPRIFEPFFTTKGVGEGTGLGLDTSYRIVVDRHHGELCADSRPGDTRFQVRLPLAPEKEAAQTPLTS